MTVIQYVTITLTSFSLLTPQNVHSYTIMPFQILLLIMLAYHLTISIRSYKQERSKSVILFWGTAILLITVGHDIAQGYGYGFVIPLVPLGGVIVSMLHSYYVARNSHMLFQEREHYSNKLAAINRTLTRFVPDQFFTLLDKTPTTIAIGCQIRRKMAVAFCDIRNLSTLTTSMNSEEKYALVSFFLKEVTPLFASYGGFIDKYIGDSVMVIFPDKPEDAMKASLAILSHFYSDRVAKECAGVRVGIGIHYGPMTLGVIGAEERMENTVIGDAVNTASRMQSLTNRFDADLIVSNEVLSGGRFENETFHLRSLGTLAVKGKRERTTIQEIFFVVEGQESSKLHSRNSFEQAIVFYEAGQFEMAEQLFRQSLETSPDDTAARAFAESCRLGGAQILTTK